MSTTVPVESAFSTYKQTRDEQQWSMESETHICRISYSFNGVVPPGKVLIAPMAPDTSTRRPPVHKKGATFSSIEDVVEVATSEESAPASQQSTAASAGKLAG